VVELRQELEARNLSPKGLKSQLIARLTKTLKTEQEKDEKGLPGEEEVKCHKLTYGAIEKLFVFRFCCSKKGKGCA